jgi:hypothetical protein
LFANDNPLNGTDPLGQCGGWFGFVCKGFDATRHFVYENRSAIILTGVTLIAGAATFGIGAAILPTEFALTSEVFGSAAVEATSSSVDVSVMRVVAVLTTPSELAATALRLGAPLTLTIVSGAFAVHEAITASKSKRMN